MIELNRQNGHFNRTYTPIVPLPVGVLAVRSGRFRVRHRKRKKVIVSINPTTRSSWNNVSERRLLRWESTGVLLNRQTAGQGLDCVGQSVGSRVVEDNLGLRKRVTNRRHIRVAKLFCTNQREPTHFVGRVDISSDHVGLDRLVGNDLVRQIDANKRSLALFQRRGRSSREGDHGVVFLGHEENCRKLEGLEARTDIHTNGGFKRVAPKVGIKNFHSTCKQRSRIGRVCGLTEQDYIRYNCSIVRHGFTKNAEFHFSQSNPVPQQAVVLTYPSHSDGERRQDAVTTIVPDQRRGTGKRDRVLNHDTVSSIEAVIYVRARSGSGGAAVRGVAVTPNFRGWGRVVDHVGIVLGVLPVVPPHNGLVGGDRHGQHRNHRGTGSGGGDLVQHVLEGHLFGDGDVEFLHRVRRGLGLDLKVTSLRGKELVRGARLCFLMYETGV
jgi:hypothetical protein